MAPRPSKEDGDAIDQFLQRDPKVNCRDLAALFHTTYESVNERRRKLRLRELTGIDPRRPAGSQPLITSRVKLFCIWLISRDPELTLDEIADFIYLKFDLALHKSTISRLWKSTKISYKKCYVIAG